MLRKVAFKAWLWTKMLYDKWQIADLKFREKWPQGKKKLFIGMLSGAMTLGLFGMLALFLLMMPVLPIMQKDVLFKQDISVTFYDKDGQVLGRRGIKLDDSTPLDGYPSYLLQAVLNTEDRRFWSHNGIDPIGTVRAALSNSKGKSTQGGSSITQQVAKNLFLSNERTFQRKVNEAFLAVWLENNLSKDEILKLYLDRSYLGGGVHGVTEAARLYFGKVPEDINIIEAATIAGMFKAPVKYNPASNPQESMRRTQVVLNSMIEQGLVKPQEVDDAMNHPTPTVKTKSIFTPDYFLDWAYEEVRRAYNEGKLGKDKVLHVYTGFDSKTQQHAETVIDRYLEQQGKNFQFDQVAVVVMDVDGLVRSMVGGVDYAESAFNRASKGMRQPGSSFKPIVYAAAMREGLLDANTVVIDRPTCVGRWCPKNYSGGYSGSMPAWLAMAKSINSIPVQLNIQMAKNGTIKEARARIIDTAHEMGMRSQMYDAQSLPIGSVEVTPLDMAVSYAVFANGGHRVEPRAWREIKNSNGDVLLRDDKLGPRVFDDKVVQNMNFMLGKVVEQGTATSVRMPGQAIAGKTGTSNSYRDAWFVGYTGTQVAAVWAGNDDFTPTKRMTGGSVPARIWRDVMEESLKTQVAKAPPFMTIAPVVVAAAKPKPAERPVVQQEVEYPPAVEQRTEEVKNPFKALFKAIFD